MIFAAKGLMKEECEDPEKKKIKRRKNLKNLIKDWKNFNIAHS